MPFDARPFETRRIAVIGGGITGMGAALRLGARHRVTLIEGEPGLGGHARTREVNGAPVDTGFIVFNHATYPRLTRLFEDLGVPAAPSDMSFGVSTAGGALEYAVRDANAFFAQRRNIASPAHWRMLRDIFRFNERAEAAVEAEPGLSVGELIGRLGLGARFRDQYLTPFTGAIWSTPTRGVLAFPAGTLVRFFRNHGLMGMTGQHQWWTVRGGSREYVSRLGARLSEIGVETRTGTPVRSVRRLPHGVEVRTEGAAPELFDEVVMATHADVTLRLLADADPVERAALSPIRYQPNEAVLHTDASVMPRRRRVWSSWNYAEPEEGRGERIALTYWMNSLQPLETERDVFVTLNGTGRIDSAQIHDVTTFRHPMMDAAAVAAQGEVQAMQGRRATWYCGAWLRNGFHEDGLATAEEVAETILARPAVLAAE